MTKDELREKVANLMLNSFPLTRNDYLKVADAILALFSAERERLRGALEELSYHFDETSQIGEIIKKALDGEGT